VRSREDWVTTGRTSQRKAKRRSTTKPPRRNTTAQASQTSDKKKIALLTRELSEAQEREKALSRELSEAQAREKATSRKLSRALDQHSTTSRELNEALEQQAAASHVLGIISSSPIDLKPVFKTILENATRLCEAFHATLWLVEGEGFRAAARYGELPAGFVETRGSVFRPGQDVPFVRAARTQRALHVHDLRREQAYLDGDELLVRAVDFMGVRTSLAVPMLEADQSVGVIAVYRQEVRPFTDKQIGLVTNFAAQAAIAIENARLLNELRQRTRDLSEALEQQTAMADICAL
jgi:GAF domain-containing protein